MSSGSRGRDQRVRHVDDLGQPQVDPRRYRGRTRPPAPARVRLRGSRSSPRAPRAADRSRSIASSTGMPVWWRTTHARARAGVSERGKPAASRVVTMEVDADRGLPTPPRSPSCTPPRRPARGGGRQSRAARAGDAHRECGAFGFLPPGGGCEASVAEYSWVMVRSRLPRWDDGSRSPVTDRPLATASSGSGSSWFSSRFPASVAALARQRRRLANISPARRRRAVL